MAPVIEGSGLSATLSGSGAPGSGTNEQQTITVNGSPTGGTFRLGFAGATTTAIAHNAAAATVQTALRALSTLGASDVDVTGSAGGPWTAEFKGDRSKRDVPLMTLVHNDLTGGTTPTVALAVSVAGVEATGIGTPVGGKYVDTDDGTEYRNTGTPAAPVWATTDAVDTGELAPGVLSADAAGRALMADDFFNVATADAKIADDAFDEAFLVAKIAADAFTEAAVDSAFAAGSVDNDILKPGTLTGVNAAVLADDAETGGLPVVFKIAVPSGANGDVDLTPLAQKVYVMDAWFVMKGAGTAGCLLTLKNGATAITEAFDCAASIDKARVQFVSFDDAQQAVAAAGTLRASKASTGGDFPGADLFVLAVRVA